MMKFKFVCVDKTCPNFEVVHVITDANPIATCGGCYVELIGEPVNE